MQGRYLVTRIIMLKVLLRKMRNGHGVNGQRRSVGADAGVKENLPRIASCWTGSLGFEPDGFLVAMASGLLVVKATATG